MSIKQTVITECICDLCGSACKIEDSYIKIKVNNGDGRDVGPATIKAILEFCQPYSVSGGNLCKSCKKEWLKFYLDNMDNL